MTLMSNPRKRNIPSAMLDELIAEQRHLCAYCQLPFGTVVYWPKHGNVVQSPVGDHFHPYALGGRTSKENAVASCNVCNTLKNDNVFESISATWDYLGERRRVKRIRVAFVPSVSLTRNPVRWTTQYTKWLSS